MHPLNVDLPKGFKVLKFDTFGGIENPLAHFRAYCDQLIGVGSNEALLMHFLADVRMENHWNDLPLIR